MRLHQAVRQALLTTLADRGTPAQVWCHISHLYAAGASLYFTILAQQEPEAEVDQWAAAKVAACQAILANGGTIIHHHGIGEDHASYLPREIGDVAVRAMRAVKSELDPAGIMNPAKLLPPVPTQ